LPRCPVAPAMATTGRVVGVILVVEHFNKQGILN